MAINDTKLILISSLQQNFIDPNTRDPAIGEVSFYNAGTLILKPVFMRSNDPDAPYIAAPNPLVLDAAGSIGYPLYAYPYDLNDETNEIFYDFVVDTFDKREIFRINNWPPLPILTAAPGKVNDYVVNGQFNYPIKFYNASNEINQISQPNTYVSPAWFYNTDADLKKYVRRVEFEEVINTTEIDLPKYLFIVDSRDIDSTESFSRLIQIIGSSETLSSDRLAFSFFAQDKIGNGLPISLWLHRDYGQSGAGASSDERFLVGNFNITSTYAKYNAEFNIPSISGKTIVSPSYLSFYFEFPTAQTYRIAVSTVVAKNSDSTNPSYSAIPEAELNSLILGQSIDFQQLDTGDNSAIYTYRNGRTYLERSTGNFAKISKKALKQNMLVLKDSKQSLLVDGSNDYNFPYKDLFDIFGTSWGGLAELSITKVGANIISFKGLISGEPKNGYTKGYDPGAINITKTIKTLANKYGVKAKTVNSALVLNGIVAAGGFNSTKGGTGQYSYGFKYNTSGGSVVSNNIIQTMTSTYEAVLYINSITPTTTVLMTGSGVISTIIDNQGGANWQTTIRFATSNPADYKSTISQKTAAGANTYLFSRNVIAFGTNSYNLGEVTPSLNLTNPNTLFLCFTVDGQGNYLPPVSTAIAQVNLKSNDTFQQILAKILVAINTPFEILYKINRAPSAGEAFKFSSPGGTGIQYYAWYKVNGSGTDPAETGTPIKVEILSTDSVSIVVDKTVAAAQIAVFGVPSKADVGMPQTGDDALYNDVVTYL